MTAELKLKVRNDIYLSSVTLADKSALLEHFRTRDVYDTTLNIPFPYLPEHANWWLQRRIEQTRRLGKEVCFAVRTAAGGKLIGCISADTLEPHTSHKAEIGYWLAKPFWGRGIMTDVVRTYVDYAFHELGVVRLTAHTFEFNLASARVLEKNKFQLEGCLRKHLMKEGKLINARFYGLLKEDLEE
jgi:[ribosomal protein S5]-alanine N-acetyltransferase